MSAPTLTARALATTQHGQHGMQQHGDTFAESDQPTDTSGIEQDSAPNRVVALRGDEPSDEEASGASD